MQFKIKGHMNILGTHPTTLEFTKDKNLTLNGNCIIGVDSDFKFDNNILNYKKIRITLICNKIKDVIKAEVNPDFSDNNEIIIRKSKFLSKRTLGFHADKAAIGIKRSLIKQLKNKDVICDVIIEEGNEQKNT